MQQKTPSRSFFISIISISYFVLANVFSRRFHLELCTRKTKFHFDEHDETNLLGTENANSSMLPEKLYVIYGLESSGTTFVARTISSALGIVPRLNPDTVESHDKKIHIQHLSLPIGFFGENNWGYETRFSEPLGVVPVYYPTGCRVPSFPNDPPGETETPVACRSIMGAKVQTPPARYFVDITSHVQWYRAFGVDVYPIMVVRDPSNHFYGVTKTHCLNDTAAYSQYEMGRDIMVHSMKTVQPIIVSYEMLMTLQEEYLVHVYNQTNIHTSFMPKFKNGNLKHLSNNTNPYIKKRLQVEDFGKEVNDAKLFTYTGRMTTADMLNIAKQYELKRQKSQDRKARRKQILQEQKADEQYNPLAPTPKALQLLMQQIQDQEFDSEKSNAAAKRSLDLIQKKIEQLERQQSENPK